MTVEELIALLSERDPQEKVSLRLGREGSNGGATVGYFDVNGVGDGPRGHGVPPYTEVQAGFGEQWPPAVKRAAAS